MDCWWFATRKRVALGTKKGSSPGLPGSGHFLENSQETSVKRPERLAPASVQRLLQHGMLKEWKAQAVTKGLAQHEGI